MSGRDPTYAALRAFVSELVAAGVAHACVMPGARSTPLALTCAAEPRLRVWSHIDERAGAFFALGIAKTTWRPVLVVCTSGTGAANLLPAAVEACYARVPLLLLTADRPPELRDCGAPQTIDQIKLFGAHVKWFAEAAMAEAGEPYFRSLAQRALAHACTRPRAPVHINFPFREPLMPRHGLAELLRQDEVVDRPRYAVPAVAAPPPEAVRQLGETLAAARRGLIVCGPSNAGAEVAAGIVQLAAVLNWPVLADPTSQVRSGPSDTRLVVDTYDALLRDEAFATAMAPEVVLRFGPLPTSKAFLTFLQRHPSCRHIVIDAETSGNDPTFSAEGFLVWDVVATCDALRAQLTDVATVADAQWCQRWLAAAACARTAIQARMRATRELFEGKVCSELGELLPDGAIVYVGNSMPVRDLEAFWPVGSGAIRFLCNRGANGIDGFISSGLGAAAVSDTPVVIITGDVALCHDLGGLLAAKRHRVRATIIVINNDGGGIFAFLPQAECRDAFADLFYTPHGLDVRTAAELYGCAFARIASWEQFRGCVRAALAADRTSIIEVPSDRQRNVELHRELWTVVGRALREVP